MTPADTLPAQTTEATRDGIPTTVARAASEMPQPAAPLLSRPEESCAFVIFGASGDLTKRKLIPGLYNLACQNLLPHGFAVIGFAVTPMDDNSFREAMREAVRTSKEAIQFRQEVWDEFAPRLHYITADFERPDGYLTLKQRLAEIDAERGCNGNRRYIDHVQITAAESLGVEHRGKYYEEAGVLRDMFQNHLLQLMALVAMDPPVRSGGTSVRDRKADVLRAIVPVNPENLAEAAVRGQYGPGEIDGQPAPGY